MTDKYQSYLDQIEFDLENVGIFYGFVEGSYTLLKERCEQLRKFYDQNQWIPLDIDLLSTIEELSRISDEHRGEFTYVVLDIDG